MAAKLGLSKQPAEQSADKVYEALPPLRVLMYLVHEAVATRIRHRALLDVLASNTFDFSTYKNTYSQLLERDQQALYAKTMLNADDFREIFLLWAEGDTARYGLPASTGKKKSASKKRLPPA